MSNGKLIVSAKPPKGEDGYRTFSIRIKEQTASRLEAVASKSGRSRNEIIGMFLEYALANCEVKTK